PDTSDGPHAPGLRRAAAPGASHGPVAGVSGRCHDGTVLLSELVTTHAAVAATRSRLRKRELLAGTLRRVADDGDAADASQEAAGAPSGRQADEVEIVASYLSGRLRQRRTGVGGRSLTDLPPAATDPTLTPVEVD